MKVVRMEEGVSLSLSWDGFLDDNHLVVSVPFSSDIGLNGGFILQDLQAVEGDSFRVYIVGSARHISLVAPATNGHFRSGGKNLLDQIIFSHLAVDEPMAFRDASVRPLVGAVKRDSLSSGSGDGFQSLIFGSGVPDSAFDVGKNINGGSHEGEKVSVYGSTDLRISTTDLDHGVAVSVDAGVGSSHLPIYCSTGSVVASSAGAGSVSAEDGTGAVSAKDGTGAVSVVAGAGAFSVDAGADVVPDFWDPFLLETDLVGNEVCASDPIEGLDDAFNAPGMSSLYDGMVGLSRAVDGYDELSISFCIGGPWCGYYYPLVCPQYICVVFSVVLSTVSLAFRLTSKYGQFRLLV